jgi:polyhydroxyalkanoate synthesis repressor PhaR
MAEAQSTTDGEQKVAIVKKYANRRLYNTGSSRYVTLDDLSQMVRQGQHFVVHDAKTGEDLTRSILTQIILEEDGKGRNLLPISFLRQLISFYDDSLRVFLPRYLELSMENFCGNQEQIRRYIEGTLGRFFPMSQFEDMARQNIALFQRAASLLNPLTGTDGERSQQASAGTAAPSSEAHDTSVQIKELNERIEALQKQLGELIEVQQQKR